MFETERERRAMGKPVGEDFKPLAQVQCVGGSHGKLYGRLSVPCHLSLILSPLNDG